MCRCGFESTSAEKNEFKSNKYRSTFDITNILNYPSNENNYCG